MSRAKHTTLSAKNLLTRGHSARIGLLFDPGYTLPVPQANTFVSPNIDQRDDPLCQIQAGFSFARPGGVSGRRLLNVPLAGRIFVAGEALSIGSHSSAHGAFVTGQQAAAQVLKVPGAMKLGTYPARSVFHPLGIGGICLAYLQRLTA